MRNPRTRLYHEHTLTAGSRVTLEASQAHYLQHVLRLQAGDRVALFNSESGEYSATIESLHKKRAELLVQEQRFAPLPVPDVWVCFAPIKYGKIDFMAQKLTELGAAKLQPAITAYTVVHRLNYERLQANTVEAAQQCERTQLPEIGEAKELRHLLAEWPEDRPLYYGDESGTGVPAAELFATERPDRWAVLIGPEGGFSPEEHALLRGHALARPVLLGPRILRADTAAITLLALTQAAWGDWQIAPHFTPEENSHG